MMKQMFKKYIPAVLLIIAGIVTYEVLVDTYKTASWPGYILTGAGFIYLFSVPLLSSVRHGGAVKPEIAPKTKLTGYVLVICGILTLAALAFTQDSLDSIIVYGISAVFITLGLLLVVFSGTRNILGR